VTVTAATACSERSFVIDMARPSAILAHAGKTVLVASIIPSTLFYVTMNVLSLGWAIAVALGWYYAVLLVRRLRGRPIVGAAMLGAGLMTARAGVVLWTGSAYLYFIQPVAGTVATATSFAVTALAGRPLIERLVHDFVPVPCALSEKLRNARFFHFASGIWATAYAVNAIGTVWLLTYSSLGTFVLLKSVLSPLLTAATVAVTVLLLRRLLRREGIRLHWSPRADPPVPAFA
jgi:hypothetical protein